MRDSTVFADIDATRGTEGLSLPRNGILSQNGGISASNSPEMAKECRVWTIKDGYRLGDDIQSKVLAFAFGLSAEIERHLHTDIKTINRFLSRCSSNFSTPSFPCTSPVSTSVSRRGLPAAET